MLVALLGAVRTASSALLCWHVVAYVLTLTCVLISYAVVLCLRAIVSG
jgi:hypothetical protein